MGCCPRQALGGRQKEKRHGGLGGVSHAAALFADMRMSCHFEVRDTWPPNVSVVQSRTITPTKSQSRATAHRFRFESSSHSATRHDRSDARRISDQVDRGRSDGRCSYHLKTSMVGG
jgi:hypothetical protein